MHNHQQDLLNKLNFVLEKGEEAAKSKRRGEYVGEYIDSSLFAGFRSAGLSFLHRNIGDSDPYTKEFKSITERSDLDKLNQGVEILKNLMIEIQNGRLTSMKGLISAEIFSNYLEMAEHLLENNYKDPAAVIIGSTLEEHIRQLCIKNNIEIQEEKKGKMVAISADTLNNSLCGKDTYNKLVQKSITAWLDLRNKAAHGQYTEYTVNQVKNMYDGVLSFMTTYSL